VAVGLGRHFSGSCTDIVIGQWRAMVVTGTMPAMPKEMHAKHATDDDKPEPVVADPFHCSFLV
jgi:hypothetical protein